VDVNKGDDLVPKYRSRLVARQIKAMDTSGGNFFAPAPPIEALRGVLSLTATSVGEHKPDWNPQSERRTQISLIDVSRAYFNAICDPDEPCYVELPPEDSDAGRACALLLRHMYGTRRAADGWQEEYSTLLVQELGFSQGLSCPNVFFNAERGIRCSVHGDDFTSSGPKPELDWLENEIGKRYEITIQPRLGPGPGDAKEGLILNRVVRWCEDHLEYEADPRQVERLVADCGLEQCKTVGTPGVRAAFKELEEDSELKKELHTAFRGASARGNYLSTDRVDCQFACKEVCRYMAKPTTHAWGALKRLCRFLSGVPRLVYMFKRQDAGTLDVYTDTDWAGCPRTRKSTSGGCVLLGSHTIKHWSSTQTCVSLSSGEAEFNGVVKGAGMALGFQALLADFGVQAPVRVWTDSSAAIGICSRQGLGKLRHLDTHTLWIQQAVRTGRISLRKVPGLANPADLLTKHSLSRERLRDLVKLYGCEYRPGRASLAPTLRRTQGIKTTLADAATEDLMGNLEVNEREPDAAEELARPVMPHRLFSSEELDLLYPAFAAPAEVDNPDVAHDADDSVLQRGWKLASEISQEMQSLGRTKREAWSRPGAAISRKEIAQCPTRNDEHSGRSEAEAGALGGLQSRAVTARELRGTTT